MIQQEIDQAKKKYGNFNSTHEVYGVLKEEMDEFWAEVKKKPQIMDRQEVKRKRMIRELTQIAAVAQRAAQELENNEIKWV